MTATSANDYTVTAISRSGGVFTISKSTTCSSIAACTGGTAGCKSDGTW